MLSSLGCCFVRQRSKQQSTSAATTTSTFTVDNVTNMFYDVEDVARLATVDEGVLLQALTCRFLRDKIYTNVGDVLLAINPYCNLNHLYDEPSKHVELKKQLSTRSNSSYSAAHTPAHIYGTAQRMYRQLLSTRRNQCCIITGESGAGKTESAKHIIRHLVHLGNTSANTNNNTELARQLIAFNPILEAFGNAQTRLNTNSSRFGKLITLYATPGGQIVGASITCHMFEKTRLLLPRQQHENETSFHIFSYIVECFDSETKLKYNLLDSDCSQSDYISLLRPTPAIAATKTSRPTTRRLGDLHVALSAASFSTTDIDNIFTILASIIKLGTVKPSIAESVEPFRNSMPTLADVAHMLQINADEFYAALVYKEFFSRGEFVKRIYTAEEATDCRDAIAKSLYYRLFMWIVSQINKRMQIPANYQINSSNIVSLSVLDIFGFECLQNGGNNSFEQLCINIANERVQKIFTQYIFQRELEEYEAEGIRAPPVSNYVDNTELIEMLFGRPVGLLSLLDEESHFPSGTDASMVAKFNHHLLKQQKFAKFYALPSHSTNSRNKQAAAARSTMMGSKFVIKHFATPVEYDCNGFLKKNRDILPEKIFAIFQQSKSLMVRNLFEEVTGHPFQPSNGTANKPPLTPVSSQCRIGDSLNKKLYRGYASMKKPTVGNQFKFGLEYGTVSADERQNLEDFVDKTNFKKFPFVAVDCAKSLIEILIYIKLLVNGQTSLAQLIDGISTSDLHFVRCIKPNKHQKPHEIDNAYVQQQLRYTGVLETVRVRREGYSYRPTFADFVQTYRGLLDVTATAASAACGGDRVACIRILQSVTATTTNKQQQQNGGWCLGRTRVFVRYWLTDKLSAMLQQRNTAASIIQRSMRRFVITRKQEERRRRLQQLIRTSKQSAAPPTATHSYWHEPPATLPSIIIDRSFASDSDDDGISCKPVATSSLSTSSHFRELHSSAATKKAAAATEAEVPRDLTLSVPTYREATAAAEFSTMTTGTVSSSSSSSSAAASDDTNDNDDDDDADSLNASSSFHCSSFRAKQHQSQNKKQADDNLVRDTFHSNDLQYFAWFHGTMGRRQAEQILNNAKIGRFLVRLSESHLGYTLSFRASDRIRHYVINHLANGDFHIPGEGHVHASLPELVEHYKRNGMSNYTGRLLSDVPLFSTHANNRKDSAAEAAESLQQQHDMRAKRSRQQQSSLRV